MFSKKSSTIYGIRISRKLTSQDISKSSGTITVIETWTHTDIQEVWKIERNSKELSRK